MRKLLFLSFLAVVFSGCATVVVESPKDLKLANSGEYLPTMSKKKVWFALWGLVPLTNNSTADMMGACNEVVRVKGYIGVDDAVIGCCTGLVTIYPLTVEVQCK